MQPFWQRKDGHIKNASQWRRPGAEFNKAKADRAVDFIETCCRHVKGEMAGQPLLLEWWFKQIVRAAYGWIRPNGTRLYREIYIEVPRKNAKSTYGGAIACEMLFAEDEPGSEIYSCAADTDQANIVHSIAKGMVEQDVDLSAVAECFRRSIVYKDRAYHVLSADAPTKHGKNSAGVLFDELHAQPNRELYDVMKTSMGSRRQPFFWMFTTAGFDRHSICWEVHEYAQKVIDGTVNDPAFLPIIFCAGETDDWTSPKIWKKANPNLGVSIKEDYLAAECEKAKCTPAYENTFKRLHLNIWTQQDVRWLQMTEWDACAAPAVNYDELRGRRCFGGLDLASTTDIAALALIFPPAKENDPFIVLPFFWIPEESMHARVLRDRVPYDVWQREGFIEATPGNSIDYRYIMLRLGRCRVDFDFKALAFDRWGSTQITTTLCDEYGFTSDEKEAANFRKPMLWQFGQGFSSMTGPTKELLNYILARKITHGGNPVLRWMAQNVVVKQDPAGNIKPDKGKSIEKIDGIVATIMALELAIRHGNEKGSIYGEREMRFL